MVSYPVSVETGRRGRGLPSAARGGGLGEPGSLTHGFHGLHEGCGCRSGWEKQVLHRHVHFPCCHPKLVPRPLNLPAPPLPQEGTRPASCSVSVPSKLQRSAKWVSLSPSRPNSIGKSTFRWPHRAWAVLSKAPVAPFLSKLSQIPVLDHYSIAVRH